MDLRKARLEVEDMRHCTIPDEDLGKDSRREERGNGGSRECSGVEAQGTVLAGNGDMGIVTTEVMAKARLNFISMFMWNVSS